MADYIRRLVSGPKARFKDDELKVELDLVYVTDQIIIMGYPASGFEEYYRNKREDVKKFLDYRHGKNYWIFNFCPLGENSYDASKFEGRVSRYPFPDHHAPPLAIMPLVAREMREWLSTSPERVAVLHCKAGKGRSGTMACAYLVSLDETPAPPKLKRSHTAKEWAKKRTEATMEAVEPVQDSDSPSLVQASSSLSSESNASVGEIGDPPRGTRSPETISPTRANPERSFTDALKGVLDLHTTRRMKAPSDPLKKQKQGVSIPSQRRFLYYWALCLAHEAPPGFWSLTPSLRSIDSPDERPWKHVRLVEIKLRLRELSGVKMGLVKAANIIIDKAMGRKSPSTSEEHSASEDHVNTDTGVNHIWASLARYDEELVNTLEQWEKFTRDEQGNLGIRKHDSPHLAVADGQREEEHLAKMFHDGRWDTRKMVHCFARLGEVKEATRTESQGIDKDEKLSTYTLQPLTQTKWQGIKKDIETHSEGRFDRIKTEVYDLPTEEAHSLSDAESRPISRTTSSSDVEKKLSSPSGIILNAEREVRIKLYMGRVFMGWIWLIPSFHMPRPSPQNDKKTTIRLTRKDVDFPIGLGSGIVDVEIFLEWLAPGSETLQTGKREGIEKRDQNGNTFTSLVVDDQYAK